MEGGTIISNNVCQINTNNFAVMKRYQECLYGGRAKVKEVSTDEEFQTVVLGFPFNDKKHEEFSSLVKSLKTFRHPSVIPLVGISTTTFERNSNPMIFYPDFSYESLRTLGGQFLSNLKLNDEIKKYTFFLSLAAGLNSLHENGVVHGMLTDEFVLVDKDFKPYIFLPGIFHICNKDMKPKEIVFKIEMNDLQFLTPEYLKNGKMSPKSDVYQFGLLFMRVMTAKHLFVWIKDKDTLQKMIINGTRPEGTETLSPLHKKFFDKCTDINPDKRPTMKEIISIFLHRDWVPKNIDQDEFYALQNRVLPENLVLTEFERLRNDANEGNTDAMVDLADIQIKKRRNDPKTGDIDEAVKLLKTAIEKKNYNAMVKYGELLEEGIGVEKNKELAFSFYKKAAKKKNKNGIYHCALNISDEKGRAENLLVAANMDSSEACFQYGECLLTGNGVKPDFNEAIKFFEKASNLGNADAMFTKGMLLRSGELGENRILEGNTDIMKAAKNNHILAQFEYGRLYIQSTNNEEATFAFHCLRNASLKGIVQASYHYAIALIKGYGTPPKPKEGAAILTNLDMPDSYYMLSKYYEKGVFGEEKKNEQSLFLLRKAAEKGSLPANIKIGLQMIKDGNSLIGIEKIKDAMQKGSEKATLLYADYLFKGEIIPKDTNKAMKYYELLVRKKNVKAITNCAKIFSMKNTELFDDFKATQYFHDAAELGSVDSLFEYGKRLLEGIGIQKNVKEAENAIKSAADKQHVEAALFFAKMIAEGNATLTQDFKEYIKIAADNGNSNAQFKYGAMLQQGTDGVIPNIEEAAKYYKMAAENGYARAQFSYASCLQAGAGVPKNNLLALQFFKKSAKQGLANSQYSLGLSFEFGIGCKADLSKAKKYYTKAAFQNFQKAIDKLKELN